MVRDRLREKASSANPAIRKKWGIRRVGQLLFGTRLKPLEEAAAARHTSRHRNVPSHFSNLGEGYQKGRWEGKAGTSTRYERALAQESGAVAKARLLASLTGLGGASAAAAHQVSKGKNASADLEHLRNSVKVAMGLTPAGQLHQTQNIGQPKMTALPGPSIAQVSKPKGFGRVLPGAGKNII